MPGPPLGSIAVVLHLPSLKMFEMDCTKEVVLTVSRLWFNNAQMRLCQTWLLRAKEILGAKIKQLVLAPYEEGGGVRCEQKQHQTAEPRLGNPWVHKKLAVDCFHCSLRTAFAIVHCCAEASQCDVQPTQFQYSNTTARAEACFGVLCSKWNE